MTSVCISNCISDARDPRIPVRATYVNLYKWPESDAEFVKSVRSNSGRIGGGGIHDHSRPRVVDSISCRQMYLRSYPFSKEETPEKMKCFGGVKRNGGADRGNGNGRKRKKKKKKCLAFRKVKEVSCAALCRFFLRLLSCTASVDVVDQRD